MTRKDLSSHINVLLAFLSSKWKSAKLNNGMVREKALQQCRKVIDRVEMKDKPNEIITHLRESIDDAAERSGVIESHRGIQDS